MFLKLWHPAEQEIDTAAVIVKEEGRVKKVELLSYFLLNEVCHSLNGRSSVSNEIRLQEF